MGAKQRVVPGLRDFLLAGYEVIGGFVAKLFLTEGLTQRIAWILLGLFIFGLISVWNRIPGAILFLAIFPLGITIIRAVDIARMRKRLLRVAEHPHGREPDLPAGLRERSPSIDALWTVTRCLSLVRQQGASVVESTAEGVNRSLLDRRATRLLDGSRALAAWELNDKDGAARLAALAVPAGIATIDRALGRILLSHAWHDTARLASFRKAWREEPGALSELGMLIDLRSKSTTDRVALLETLDVEVINRLSDDAQAIGDRPLASALVPPSKHVGPYR